jgi:hypothetical protein
MTIPATPGKVRLDKWLWAERKAASAGFIPSARKPGKKERRQIHRFVTGTKAIT